MLQWLTVEVVLLTFMVVNSQSKDAVFCPDHTQSIYHENKTYRACEPYLCIPRDPDDSNSTSICPKPNRTQLFHDKMLSPSCHWVRLYRYYSFNFNSSDAGTIYENGTNITHKVGDYVYNLDLDEAFICRETLQPQDDTEDITLWCTSHTIYMAEKPTELLNETGDHDLHLPHLNLTILSGFYKFHDHPQGFEVNVCLKTSLEFIRCESTLTVQHSKTEFELLSNLSLLVKWTIKPIAYSVGQYYLSADNESAIVCVKPDKALTPFQYYMYPLYIVSAIFLLFTVLVHLFYPKLNYHAKALLCCTISMMVMYICMTCKLHSYRPRTSVGRFALFGFYYVSTMSTYLWLSVLSYELWKVFTNLRPSAYNIDKKFLFAMNCVYAWGIPVTIYFLIIGLAHDHSAAEYLGLHLVKGPDSFIMSNEGVFIFIYGPLIVILMANMTFCGLTIWNIGRARTWSKLHDDKFNMKLFYLCVKLFVVMGISWVADVIAYLADESSPASYVFTVINALQGVAIFLVYVCKKSNWSMIKRKWISDDESNATRETVVSRGLLTSTDSSAYDARGLKNKPTSSYPLDPLKPVEDGN